MKLAVCLYWLPLKHMWFNTNQHFYVFNITLCIFSAYQVVFGVFFGQYFQTSHFLFIIALAHVTLVELTIF